MLTCCIVSYRYGHLVAQAIESVLCQTVQPDEIIVVDDGGYDFPEEVHEYPVIFDVHPNIGIVDNFNYILDRYGKDKILFLGADNWLRPDALERMDVDADIVSCDAYVTGTEAGTFIQGNTGEYQDGYWRWHLPNQPHGSAIYDVKKAKAVGGYEHSGREKSEEDSMLFQKMRKAGATFTHVDEPLLYYRRHRANFNKD